MSVNVTFVGGFETPCAGGGATVVNGKIFAYVDSPAEFTAVTVTQTVEPGTTPVSVNVVTPPAVEPTFVNDNEAEHPVADAAVAA